jgi:hypothetical protein
MEKKSNKKKTFRHNTADELVFIPIPGCNHPDSFLVYNYRGINSKTRRVNRAGLALTMLFSIKECFYGRF